MEELTSCSANGALCDLPEELLAYIIHYVDSDPPSVTSSSQPPRVDVLFLTATPLKNLSAVSRQLRRITKPLLFQHLRVCLDDVVDCLEADFKPDEEPWSKKTADTVRLLPRFAERFELHGPIASLMVYQRDVSFDMRRRIAGKPSHLQLLAWSALLAQVIPVRLSIIAPPQTLALLLQRDLWLEDAWAFKISLQRIDLVGDPTQRKATTDLSPSQLATPSFHRIQDSREWRSFAYHGGSCLPSFGTYHYFLKVPPCLLTANDDLRTLLDLGAGLSHFSYATLFPHYHHFHKVLRNVARTMPALQSLELQLAPSPASDVWCNLELIGRGNLNLRDCWAEIERSYASLVELLDIQVVTGRPVFERLERVAILDCRIKTLETELDAMIVEKTSRWVKVDEVTLERRDAGGVNSEFDMISGNGA